MKKKVLDILDLLEPATIKIKEYDNDTEPSLDDDSWVDSGDQTIIEIAKLLPYQLSFIHSIIHEYPHLLPDSRQNPGRMQELLFLDIMEKLKSKTPRDLGMERKIVQLWIDNGGSKPSSARKDK